MMKRIIFRVFLSILCLQVSIFVKAQSSNPVVKRLSATEIASNTPLSVAYNYVMTIILKDYDKAASYLELSEATRFKRDLREYGVDLYEDYYLNEVGLKDWDKALKNGYELTVTDIGEDCWAAKTDGGWAIHPEQTVKDGMVYIPGDENPHIGIYRKTIYVACCPISEINRSTFNDIHRYNDVLVQISVEMDNGKWIVRGGKKYEEGVVCVEAVETNDSLETVNEKVESSYYPNPIVHRMSNQEIASCNTPSAVAYNFVIAMINKNQDKMIQLSEGEFNEVVRSRFDELISSLENDSKLNVYQWLPLRNGYEIAVLYEQEETPGVKKIYIDCIPSEQIGTTGFQDITRDMKTNVKVLVNNYNGRWLVEGFK